MQAITPCLWFENEALEAAELYVSLFDDSAIKSVSRLPAAEASGAGDVFSVEFSIGGMRVQALNGRTSAGFTDAFSLSRTVDSQSEVDRLWSALIAGGGEPGRCGWLRDPFGISWQIVPTRLGELLSDPDRAAAARVMQAMLSMSKIDIAGLEAAYSSDD